MAFYGRGEIGLRPPTYKTDLPTYPATHVIIHHGATETPKPKAEDEMATLRGYQNHHIDTRGWSDIAYNHGVGQSGHRYGLRGWGRQGGATGSPQDTYSMSICAVGNFDTTKPSDELIDAIVATIKAGLKKGHLHPKVKISGHRDHKQTSCPGVHLYNRIPDIRWLVKQEDTVELTLEQRVQRLEAEVFGP